MAIIIFFSLTTFFTIYSSRYIKPSILLRSASIDSRKNYSIKLVAFLLLLLWYRVCSLRLLLGGNYSRAFSFLSALYTYFTILYTPLGSFINFLIAYLYSLLASYYITLFFFLYINL